MTSANTCPDCGQTYLPEAGHCRGGRWGGCCRSFANNARNHDDPHRTGDHNTTRRCMTDSELLAAGWEQAGHLWVSPAGVRSRTAIAMRGGRLQATTTEGTPDHANPA